MSDTNTPTPRTIPSELLLLIGHPLMGEAIKKAVQVWGELERDLAARERENQCDVCAGTGKPLSGKQCACNGSGKMSDAAITFRRDLVAREAELARVREELKTADRLRDSLHEAQGILHSENVKQRERAERAEAALEQNAMPDDWIALTFERDTLKAALAEARKLLHEMVDAWDNGVEDDSIIASRRTTDAFRKAREYLAAIDAREGK